MRYVLELHEKILHFSCCAISLSDEMNSFTSISSVLDTPLSLDRRILTNNNEI